MAAWPFLAVWALRSVALIPGVIKDVMAMFWALVTKKSIQAVA